MHSCIAQAPLCVTACQQVGSPVQCNAKQVHQCNAMQIPPVCICNCAIPVNIFQCTKMHKSNTQIWYGSHTRPYVVFTLLCSVQWNHHRRAVYATHGHTLCSYCIGFLPSSTWSPKQFIQCTLFCILSCCLCCCCCCNLCKSRIEQFPKQQCSSFPSSAMLTLNGRRRWKRRRRRRRRWTTSVTRAEIATPLCIASLGWEAEMSFWIFHFSLIQFEIISTSRLFWVGRGRGCYAELSFWLLHHFHTLQFFFGYFIIWNNFQLQPNASCLFWVRGERCWYTEMSLCSFDDKCLTIIMMKHHHHNEGTCNVWQRGRKLELSCSKNFSCATNLPCTEKF